MNQRRYSTSDRTQHQHFLQAFQVIFFSNLFISLCLSSSEKTEHYASNLHHIHDWGCWVVRTFTMKLKSNNVTELCQNVISHRTECWNGAAAQGPGKIIIKRQGTGEK